jgi:hypothetical protein
MFIFVDALLNTLLVIDCFKPKILLQVLDHIAEGDIPENLDFGIFEKRLPSDWPLSDDLLFCWMIKAKTSE